MKLSQIKALKTFTESLFSTPDYKEVIENISKGESDFEIDNVRFIESSHINQVLADELSSDTYCLGSFTASFIAAQSGWPEFLIAAAQSGEAYEELGQAMVDGLDMVCFAEEYASADSYGHHFNSYDFEEEEVCINGTYYHVFDNH